jgi:tripartite-type tricarboxylate transporter receptor subunit TctC
MPQGGEGGSSCRLYDLEQIVNVAAGLLVLLCLAASDSAFAQVYPARPIRMIVPYPAGGGTDIAARWICQKLSERLNQQVFVDNRAGANGNLGTQSIARAAPDGYVIGMATPGPVTVGPSLYRELPYDPQKDLVPVILANESPIVLVSNLSVGALSLKDLIALARTKPGKLSAALVSTGSVPHLLTEMLKSAAGIDLLDVPYKGGGPAAMDTISGQVDVLFSVLPLVLPYITGGQLRAYAIASETRSSLLPDVPTVKEAGYDSVVGSAWNGIVTPAGTPPDVISKLNEESSQVLASSETRERFAALGMEAVGGSAESFARFLQAETQKWATVIRAAHIQAQ